MPVQKQSESPQFGRGLAIIILLGLVGALLFPGLAPISGRWPNALWNLLHIPAFFLLTLALFVLWSGLIQGGFRSVVAIGSSLLIALGTEWAQSLFGRSGNWKDFAFDLVGIGLALFWMFARQRFRRPRVLFSVVAATTFVACLWPAWGEAWAESRQLRNLPELSTFAQWETRRLWRAQGNAEVRVEDGALHVLIGEGKYGGVSFWPGRQDWIKFSNLSINLENPGEHFQLGIRIDDENSSLPGEGWFSTAILVDHGESSIEIELPSRPSQDSMIDFSGVTRLALFTGEEREGREFIVKSAFLR